MGVPQNIMRALCAVIRPDHFKFASYGPDLAKPKKDYMFTRHSMYSLCEEWDQMSLENSGNTADMSIPVHC